MTRAGSARAVAFGVVLATSIGVAALASCTPLRERPDVPVIRLSLDSLTVSPGSSVRGRITAVDRSGGLIYLAIIGVSGDSATRLGPLNFVSIDSVDRTFALHVPTNAALGSFVQITATVIDEQQFQAIAHDSARVVAARVP